MIAPKDRAPVWFAAFAAQMAQRLQAAPLADNLVRYIVERAVIFADAAQRGLEAHDAGDPRPVLLEPERCCYCVDRNPLLYCSACVEARCELAHCFAKATCKVAQS